MAKVTVLNPITNIVDTLTTTKDHEWIIFKGQNLLYHKEKRTYNLSIGDTVIDSNGQRLKYRNPYSGLRKRKVVKETQKVTWLKLQ
jgi:hypothetical protein